MVGSSNDLNKLAEAIDKHNIGNNLPPEDRDKLRNLVMRFSEVISLNDLDLGSTDLTTHKINLKTEIPIKSSPYKTNHLMRREIETQIRKMSDANVIEESDSPFASPVVLVRKKDGTYRFCIDFRKLNEQTIKDAYPIPRIDEVIEAVFDAKIFTIIDLIQGYWQVEIDEHDKHKTAFITTSGLYHFNKMPFGLCNAPATFQRLMNKVLTGILWKRCIVYLDDIIIYAKTFSDHLEALEEVFKRLSRAGLKIKLSKCHFITNTVRYLGFLITADGLKTDPSKVSVILNVEVPKNVKDVRAFLGMASYYRRFMPNFSHIAEPLTNLTRKRIIFKWTQECDISFNEIKKLLTEAPVLKLPDVDKPFILQCDASGKALGAVLAQINADGYEQPIAYASRALTETEQKYTTTEREGLVIVWAITYFKYLICDQPVDVYTDHRPLAVMRSVQEPYGRIGRFILKIQHLNLKLNYKPGATNQNADALSRLNQVVNNIVVENWSKTQQSNFELEEIRRAVLEGKCISNPQYKRLQDCLSINKFDVLVKKSSDGNERIVVLNNEISNILRTNHDSPLAGHLGFEKTLQRVRSDYFWPKMYDTVRKYCSECPVCQKFKTSIYTKHELKTFDLSGPWFIVGIDIAGPLTVTEIHHCSYLSFLQICDY